jgi:hypothetical protein
MHVGTPLFIAYLFQVSSSHPSHPAKQAEESKVSSTAWTAKSMSSPSFSPHILDQPFPSHSQCQVFHSVALSHQLTHSFIPSIVWSKIIHARPFSAFFSLSRRRVNVRLFRHHAQQATSEKKRISTVSRRPRAYTASTQQRSAFLRFSLFVLAYK